MSLGAGETNRMSSSRDKENKPPSSSLRARSSIPSLVKSPQKEELYTNSFLGIDDASQTSLIPTPQKLHTSLSKPRQKISAHRLSHSGHEDKKSRRSPRPHVHSLLPRDSSSSGSSIPRRRSPLRPLRTSTPPLSTDGSSLTSPASTFSSPPRALTDVYQRIEQEEDLAATEGQISDPDDLPVDDDVDESIINKQSFNRRLFTDEETQDSGASRGPTPTQDKLNAALNRTVSDRVEVMSDPTGMSFFEQMEDRDLAAKLTPMALQAAADKQALRNMWSKQRPVAFGKALKYRHAAAVSAPDSPRLESLPKTRMSDRMGKFKELNGSATNGYHHRAFSDVTEHIDRPFLGINEQEFRDGAKDNQNFARTLPVNPHVQRPHFFAKNHGFPPRNQLAAEVEIPPASRSGRSDRAKSDSPAVIRQYLEPTGDHQDTPSHAMSSLRSRSAQEESTRAMENKSRTSGSLADRISAMRDPSRIDWLQVEADTPIPSVEKKDLKHSAGTLMSAQKTTSPERVRKWENDFTGFSFQVSESPPVRSKVQAEEYARSREIQGLAKAAVTTNRLTQLRERESREQLRSPSKSPGPETLPKADTEVGLRDEQEYVSDTDKKRTDFSLIPRRSTSSLNTERPSTERSKSHDILQRLARGSSSTPRSSPPPGGITKEFISKALVDDPSVRQTQSPAAITEPVEQTIEAKNRGKEAQNIVANGVKDTPRVVGAWTDTILPDTIKTTRQPQKLLTYAQTPHVSAGGWVDTPYVPANPQALEPVTEDEHDIPAELMDGIVKSEVVEPKTEIGREEILVKPLNVPKGMALQLLAQQKEKLNASEMRVKQDGDTLNLGNATIQSLEDLLDMDEAEITTLSRLGDNTLPLEGDFNEDEVLERLGIKLDRLRNHIHDARKGIAKLEHQVSARVQEDAVVAIKQAEKANAEMIEQKPLSTTVATGNPLSVLPAALITICLPIPLLFHPRQVGDKRRLPRPTLLGWVTFIFWAWYLIECVLCEIYSHPQFAEVYVWPAEPEPQFPYVLPTMLWRWSRMDFFQPLVVQPVSKVFQFVFRFISMWLGMADGFVDDALSTASAAYAQASSVGGGQDLDMMSDEFI